MRPRNLILGLALLLAVSALAPPALAAPQDDFDRVYRDYTGDDGTLANDVASCAHTREQLVNARNVATSTNDMDYYTAFIAEVDQEIARHDSGFCAGVAPDPSGGSQNPDADFEAVFDDWRADGQITPCRFTRPQLVSALNVAGGVTDFDSYAPGFREAVRAEIARIDRGDCAGQAAAGALRIAKVKAKAKRKRREYVVIRNVSRRAVALRGFTLRDRAGNRIRMPRGFSLRAGRSLRVTTGCLGKRKRPVRRRARFYACKRKLMWNDRGDVVKLVDGRGTVVAQRGFGRYRSVPRF